MKLLRIVCIFLILICGLITLSYADNNQMIICNDQNLYNVLCSFFGDSKIVKKDNEKLIIEVSKETLDAITELDLSNKNISDLKGLEVFSNLVSLRVSNNQISNLSPIKDLNTIQYLYLNQNNISDLSLLVSSVQQESFLTILDLSQNKIADISSVSNFSNLMTLNLAGNQISSVDAIANLEKLNNLFLNSNNISDISTLSKMTNLKVLNLQNNKITKIDTLELGNLESLNLKNNRLTNVDFLSGLNLLSSLDLSYNQIVKIPEFFANWINNKKIADIKLNNQTLNLVTQDTSVDFGKNSSYTNLLYFGFFFKPDLKVSSENGNLDVSKLIFSITDLNTTGKITINDGVFKNSTIRIDHGGSLGTETAPEEDGEIITEDGNTTENNETVGDTNTTDNTVVDENTVTDNNTVVDNNTTEDNSTTPENNGIIDNSTQNESSNGDSTIADGKMPYTGVASKIFIVIIFISAVLIGAYTFSKNKK